MKQFNFTFFFVEIDPEKRKNCLEAKAQYRIVINLVIESEGSGKKGLHW